MWCLYYKCMIGKYLKWADGKYVFFSFHLFDGNIFNCTKTADAEFTSEYFTQKLI